MCPHGQNSYPSSCSQCLGAGARRVRSDEHGVTIDGVKVRAGIVDDGIAVVEGGGELREKLDNALISQRTSAGAKSPADRPCTRKTAALPAPASVASPEVPVQHTVTPAAAQQPAVAVIVAAPRKSEPTSRQREVAKEILEYAVGFATLAVPTPAGDRAIALFEAIMWSDEDIADLHRMGMIELARKDAVDVRRMRASLRERGWTHTEQDPSDCVICDGVEYAGVWVVATPSKPADVAHFDDIVWLHHEKTTMGPFAWHVLQLSRGKRGADADVSRGAAQFLCSEWDRIRGVLPGPPLRVTGALPRAVEVMIREACREIPPPPALVGRPRVPVDDVVCGLVLRAAQDGTFRSSAAALQATGIKVHHNTLHRAAHDPHVGVALRAVASSSGVADIHALSNYELAAVIWERVSST